MSTTVTRVYGDFRGADFRSRETDLARSPDCLNVWKDYRQPGGIRTRPGLALHTGFSAPVYGVFFFRQWMLVHSGDKLYRVAGGVTTQLCTGLSQTPSDGFVYEDTWYFKDGARYLQYDGTAVAPVAGYVPTTTIGRRPSGGGTAHEDVNMLTGRRINSFLADGSSTEYYLDTVDLDADFPPIVRVDGAVVSSYAVDYTKGVITFASPVSEPLTAGQDNVTVEFCKTVGKYRACIEKCTLLQVFDNRVFFSGNPEWPGYVWHSSLDDPTYCSDLDYYKEGLDGAPVRGMAAGNNVLWVFRAPSDANTTVFYHVPTIDADYGKIYPSAHSSIATGCVGGAVNFNDDIVFFSQRGMEGISGDITTEQVLSHRSALVDRKLLAEADYQNMRLAEWEGYLLVFIGSRVYLADSRTAFTLEDHLEYEWFYWELGQAVTSVRVHGGVLYLGTASGVYTLTDAGAAVASHWVTPKDRFQQPNRLKTTNKRGCLAEATGDITLAAKGEDGEFEEIGTYENVTDHFVTRLKRKKFKDLQLKFASGTRFSLEAVTLECFVGGYIKR